MSYINIPSWRTEPVHWIDFARLSDITNIRLQTSARARTHAYTINGSGPKHLNEKLTDIYNIYI